MDLNRIYNKVQVWKRTHLLCRLRAEEVLSDAHDGSDSIARQIELAFRSFHKQKKTRLSVWIAHAAACDECDRSKRISQFASGDGAGTLADARRASTSAQCRAWRDSHRAGCTHRRSSPRSCNAARQFGELARFLLAHWPVPKFFDDAWSETASDIHRQWFIHIGAGTTCERQGGCRFRSRR